MNRPPGQALENRGMFAPLAGTSGLSSNATISAATSSGVRPGTQRGVGPAQHLGVDGARADADGADAVLPALHRDRLGEADDPVFGDVVGGQARELLGGVDAGQRGDGDDPPFAGRDHSGERRAAAEERTRQVDPERLVPDPVRGLGKRRGRQHSGRADQGGDRAPPPRPRRKDARPRRPGSRPWAPPWPRRPRAGCGRPRRRGLRGPGRPARRARPPRLWLRPWPPRSRGWHR